MSSSSSSTSRLVDSGAGSQLPWLVPGDDCIVWLTPISKKRKNQEEEKTAPVKHAKQDRSLSMYRLRVKALQSHVGDDLLRYIDEFIFGPPSVPYQIYHRYRCVLKDLVFLCGFLPHPLRVQYISSTKLEHVSCKFCKDPVSSTNTFERLVVSDTTA